MTKKNGKRLWRKLNDPNLRKIPGHQPRSILDKAGNQRMRCAQQKEAVLESAGL